MRTLAEELAFIPEQSTLFNRRIVTFERLRESVETWAGKQILRDGRNVVKTFRQVPVRARIRARFVNDWNKGQIAFIVGNVKTAFQEAKAKGYEVRMTG
jgi:hypothetical protein